ncbi:SCO2525 family SAM-dependent methyltransferase [Sphaerisporangium viridialbum]|uniref:SCO2525 family SAM-dependent methyltransferase n=1 Tax=Sphaerisporangium viridialbum TaxID=46189 RepID=UPI003C70D8C3
MTGNQAGDTLVKGSTNTDYPWDEFDPHAYWQHNYGALREDDRKMVEQARDFFAGIRDVYDAEGLDVGTGPNLYPALAMLPLCGKITLWEHSRANVEWLEREVLNHSPTWDPFWNVLTEKSRYQKVGDSRSAIARRAVVRKGSIFDLPRAKWDVGTMFFVAESITTAKLEFERAIRSFLDALKPGAPFVIALMENSEGYRVGTHFFPAIRVDKDVVRRKLISYAPDVVVRHIDSDGLLREGYSGMILAHGRLRK